MIIMLPLKILLDMLIIPDNKISEDELINSIKELFNVNELRSRLKLNVVSCSVSMSKNFVDKEDNNE